MTSLYAPERPLLRKLQALLRWGQVDRAVAFTIAARAWQALSGPITVLVIASSFSPAVQGYYYTFASVLALQSLIELGFFVVIANVASHEWAQLRLSASGAVEGDPRSLSRLRSLLSLIVRWYAVLAIVFLLGVSLAGLRFFGSTAAAGVSWRSPWLAMVATQSVLLWTMPFVALLEGCNRVEPVSRYRLREMILTSFALWTACLLGANLWAAVAVNVVFLANNAVFLGIQHRRFFASLAHHASEERVSWRTEIWPMQWRVAIGAASGYAFALFTPILFRYHGAAVAGQMGMTLQAMTALHALGLAWVQTKLPRYGVLAAQRQWHELDRGWMRNSSMALGVVIVGAAAGWSAVALLQRAGIRVGLRFLPWPAAAFVLATAPLLLLSSCMLAYLRAHKREPVVVWAVTVSVVSALQMWIVGGRYGAAAGAAGHFCVIAASNVWLVAIWQRCRTLWHGEEAPS